MRILLIGIRESGLSEATCGAYNVLRRPVCASVGAFAEDYPAGQVGIGVLLIEIDHREGFPAGINCWLAGKVSSPQWMKGTQIGQAGD